MSATGRRRSISHYEYPSPEVTECPFPFYEALRDEAPAHRLPTGEFMVSRYEDVIHVARHPELFSNQIGPVNDELVRSYIHEDEEQSPRFTPFPLPFSDPPEHRLKRMLCLSIVSRERLLEYEPMISGVADELIDGFITGGEAEFCSQFADRLPGTVILRILNVPKEDETQLKEWLSAREGVGARMASPEQREAEGSGKARAREYFKQLIVERHHQPAGDFISDMVRMKVDRDGALDLPYLASEVTNLYGAANGTTAHLLSSAMMTLLQHPADLARVTADHEALRPFIDEVLRLESPVQWLQRVVVQDTELHGVPIPRGSIVLVVWAAANRDPEKFQDPDRFWIDRPSVARDQLAFGHGAHRCIGAALGRLEARVAFQQLLTRLPGVRLAADRNDFSHIQSFNHRQPSAVHIQFDPAHRPDPLHR